MDWLKIKWTFLSIDAPWFIWIVASLLIVGTIIFLGLLWYKINRCKKEFKQTAKDLNSLDKPAIGAGVDSETAERLRQDFANQPTMGTAWHQFETSLVTQNNAAGNPQWWRTNSANEAFSEDNLITRKLNKNAYQATPSIITGVGLLTTFAAILVALLDVRVIDGGKVVGLELLIQGLSGKFISSVVALLCATLFILLEKRWFYGLEKSRQQLVNALDRLFPQLSNVQMLINLQSGLSGFQTQLVGSIAVFKRN